LIALVVAMAAFMEVLDTSIANVALPYIAGSLGATNDQSTWVLTSYLVSNAIVLPICGWFAGVLGRKRFFMICLMIFTVSSLLCGIAPSLGAIIVFRVLQGAGGGGLQPMAQAILADVFPPEQRGLAFTVYGVTVVVAPTIGPTLMRNIGSGVGTSMVTTLIARRAQVHQCVWPRTSRRHSFPFSRRLRPCPSISSCGHGCPIGGENGVCPAISNRHCPGDNLSLHRCLSGSDYRSGDHVCAFLRVKEK
jgi:MFS family permease